MDLETALNEIKRLKTEIEYRDNEIKELKQKVENIEKNTLDEEYDDVIYPEANTEDEAEWFDLKNDCNYEICNWYPYNIRRKRGEKIIKECIRNDGYVQVAINQKTYGKHILVAKHFIPNPNHLPFVDHINHDRSDDHISNLR